MSTFSIVALSILGAILGPIILASICYWSYKLFEVTIVRSIKQRRKYNALKRRKLELDVTWLEENTKTR